MLPPDSRPPPGVAVQGMPDGGAGQQPQFHYMYGQDHTNLQVGQGDML
jgi:hypothetical protein